MSSNLSCFRPIPSPSPEAHPGSIELSPKAQRLLLRPCGSIRPEEDGWRALIYGTAELWGIHSLLSRGFVRGIVPFNHIDVFHGRSSLYPAGGIAPAVHRRVADR